MRPRAVFASLLLFVLVAGFFRTPCTQAKPRFAPKPRPPAVTVPDPTWIEDGYGQTPEDAEEVALKKARESVAAYQAEHYGLPNPVPSAAQLREMGVLTVEEPAEPVVEVDPGHPARHAQVRVTLTRPYREQMQEVSRRQRVQQRQSLLARILAGVVALLLVAVGYLRLEDATKGYYTGLLRLTAVAVLFLVGAGLWLLT